MGEVLCLDYGPAHLLQLVRGRPHRFCSFSTLSLKLRCLVGDLSL